MLSLPFLTCSYNLGPGERVTYLKYTDALPLRSGGHTRPLLLVCVAVLPDQIDYDRCTGRLYVLRLSVDGNGLVTALKRERKCDYNTPVTACDVMTEGSRYIVLGRMIDNILSSGSRVIMIDLEKERDEEMPNQKVISSYVTSIHCIYNMVVVGDIMKGMTFLMWKVGGCV